MKKIILLLLAGLFVLFLSCASSGNAGGNNQSVIVITRIDNGTGTARLTVNGKDYGKINAGKSKTFNVPNGSHTVIARFGSGASKTMVLELNNQRCELVLHRGNDTLEILSTTVLSTQSSPQSSMSQMDTAVAKSFETLNQLIPERSKIAILSITPNNNESGYIGEELMIKFVNSRKYIIVDRDTLESIRQEQRFQMAGEVSDDSAVSIGQFLGADVVITGTITGTSGQRRLRLKALDVKTAQVLAMSSEPL